MTKQKKLTLAEKKFLNEHVTGETKRCLAILKKIYYSDDIFKQVKDDLLDELFKQASKEIIKGSPYIKFYPELLRRIPE